MFGKRKKKKATAPETGPQTVFDAESKDIVRFDNVSFAYEVAADDDDASIDRRDDPPKRSEQSKPKEPQNPDGPQPREAAPSPAAEGVKYIQALTNVTLPVHRGEFLAVIGRNGSGKSTLAKLMNALLLPTEGTVIVDGIDTTDGRLEWEVRTRVGMVFQNPDNQIIGATVEEDIAFGLENLGVPRDEMIERIGWAAATVGLGDRLKKDPQMLSGGQKQRVAIAGILAMKPECIVLDEATAMLDPVGRTEVMRVAKALNREQGITVVHITHHMDEVAGCDRVVVINDGTVAASGTPRELFSDPAAMRRYGLEVPGVTALCEALANAGIELKRDVINTDEALAELIPLIRTRAIPECSTEAARLAREQLRRELAAPYVYREGPNSVAVSQLTYIYGPGTPFEKKAVEDVTFAAGDGEFLGIIGHTGCGKSTLVQHLNGLLKPVSGQVLIGGEPMGGANVKSMRRRVGLVFQYPEYQLFESTVARDVAFGIRNEGLDEDEVARRVDDALRLVGLDPAEVREKSIYDLSGGQKRRVAIAGILVMKPGILVLDEPAAGLDPSGRDEILKICSRLNREEGNTVILVSHSMDDVARLCDRVLVMANGRMEMLGAPEEVFEYEQRLSDMGLTVPMLTGLFHRLDEALPEFHISRKVYSVADGVNELLGLFGMSSAAGGDSERPGQFDVPLPSSTPGGEVSGQ